MDLLRLLGGGCGHFGSLVVANTYDRLQFLRKEANRLKSFKKSVKMMEPLRLLWRALSLESCSR